MLIKANKNTSVLLNHHYWYVFSFLASLAVFADVSTGGHVKEVLYTVPVRESLFLMFAIATVWSIAKYAPPGGRFIRAFSFHGL